MKHPPWEILKGQTGLVASSDAQRQKRTWKGGYIHHGFLASMKSLLRLGQARSKHVTGIMAFNLHSTPLRKHDYTHFLHMILKLGEGGRSTRQS